MTSRSRVNTREAKKWHFFAFFAFADGGFAQFNNGMRHKFGKSRVQHEQFFWTYYEFKDYKIYQYRGGEKLSEYVARNYRPSLKEIEKKNTEQ